MVIELSPFYRMNRNLDRLFDEFFTPLSYSQRKEAYPPLNIAENEEHVFIVCEIPGIAIEDVDITLVDSSLTIKGERKAQAGRHYRQERPSGIFQRVVRINSDIDRENIKATLKDGILEIALPKAEEVKPRKIAIEG